MKISKITFLVCLLFQFAQSQIHAQKTGGIDGQVIDSFGASIAGAVVTIVNSDKSEKQITTNRDGEFSFKNLAAGKYSVRVSAEKFALFENGEIEVKAGNVRELKIALMVSGIKEEVTVSDERKISTDPNSNASAIILTEADIENLPDDPEELEAFLQALAGTSAGLDGGEIYIDGFSGGRLPPKSSIREIRVNRNAFSAEYDRAGYGGIDIITKPGSGRFRGSAFFNFNDESLNSRNPFALNRAPSQTRLFGGSFSGPILKGKSSFTFDFTTGQNDNNRTVNASILDSAFNVVTFREDIAVPSRSLSLSSRLDFQLTKNNTFSARYNFSKNSSENQGVYDLSLPSRAFQTTGNAHDIRLLETAYLTPKTINETRFSYNVNRRTQEGDNSIPTIVVAGTFTGGGAQVGLNFSNLDRWELQNYTTTILGKSGEHIIKFGGRIRGIKIKDRSEANFGGIFTFAGVRDPATGTLLYSAIEQYRQKVLGNTDARFNPNQYIISSGNPLADISQYDLGFFVTDDWRLRQNMTLSFGLRYENQTNISDNTNFAPRLSFAWSPAFKSEKEAKTVIRGGIGVFYSRINENFFLQANRFDGSNQVQYVVSSDAQILAQPVFNLNGVTNVPTISQLGNFQRTSSFTVRRLANDLRAQAIYQIAFSIDRTLPFKTNASVSYLGSRNVHLLNTRNINAPLCPPLQSCPVNPPRPDAAQGNIYLYESGGILNQQQLIVNFNSNRIKTVSFGGSYRFGVSKSTSEGAGNFPAYSYDLSSEYGDSSLDLRHSLTFHSSFRLPWKIRVSPFVNFNSGRPFNIITGVDSNRDSIFNDRPTFAQLHQVCTERKLTNAFCDISGVENPATTIIPRNYGRGFSYSNVNLSINKSFNFKIGKERGYNLSLGAQISNLLNHTNKSAPIGNLSSNRFGLPFTSAGGFSSFGGANRRIDLQLRFNF